MADVSHLWAVADVRERDWEAMNVSIGQQVKIELPAIADRSFTGEVIRLGRRLEPTTGAASLTARMAVSDPRLRPGLFLRMTVPIGEPRQALCVPEPAVVVHEGKSLVFLAEGETSFRCQPVEVGETQAGMTEILDGLSAGQRLVTQGTFALKSEWLLTGSEE